MPWGDGTGPWGTGGWCTPLWMSGQIPGPLGLGRGFGFGFGRGFGLGRGFGRGRGRSFGRWGAYPYFNPYLGMGYDYPYYGMGYAAPYGAGFPTGQVPPEQELQMLKDNAQALQQEMEAINERIAELSKEKK